MSVCPVCDGEVPPSLGTKPRTFCSAQCSAWSRSHPGEKRILNRECRGCGADISHRAVQARFCSDACRGHTFYELGVQDGARLCAWCEVDISDRSRNARYCSIRHRDMSLGRIKPENPVRRQCQTCSSWFQPRYNDRAKYCSRLCKSREPRPYTDAARAKDQRKAAIRRGAATGRPVVLREIGDRDGWCCELCRRSVDRWLEYPDPLSPSLDHIVPLSLGGLHDPSNVRVTHLRCNVQRSNRIEGEQLPLMGLLEIL